MCLKVQSIKHGVSAVTKEDKLFQNNDVAKEITLCQNKNRIGEYDPFQTKMAGPPEPAAVS